MVHEILQMLQSMLAQRHHLHACMHARTLCIHHRQVTGTLIIWRSDQATHADGIPFTAISIHGQHGTVIDAQPAARGVGL